MATATKKHRPKNQDNAKVLGIGQDITQMKLIGSERPIMAVIGGAILDARITRTVGGASNIQIVVHDPERKLLRHKMLTEKWNAHIDGLDFRYKGATKEGPDLTLSLIELNAARMQEVVGARKAYRDRVTRAEFILSEVREVEGPKIPVRIFELHKRQPIRHSKDSQERRDERNSSGEEHTHGEPGLGRADVGHVSVKHVAASLSQIHIIDEVLDVGMSMGASFKLLVASIMTITQESDATNMNEGAAGVGPFSQEPGTWGQSYPGATNDVSEDARGFFQVGIKADKAHPSQSKAELCQAVQASADGSLYAKWEGEATTTVERYLGGAGVGSVEQTIKERYAFERAKKENAWKNTGKLAGEVRWRRFMVAGKFFYVPDSFLLRAKRRAVLDEEDSGVDTIDFEQHENVEVQEATIECRAAYWKVPPGCVAELSKDMGPAAGNYIVQSIEGSLFDSDPNLVVKIRKPVEPLKEPANETHTKSLSVPGAGAGAGNLRRVNIPSNMRSPGAPGWGGTRPIFHQFIDPFMADRGLSPGSRKRATDPGNTGGQSDHLESNTQAYATDYPTNDGERIARDLALAMGYKGWSANSYNSFTINVDGLEFEAQVLWGAAIEHGDHIHVGMHRI